MASKVDSLRTCLGCRRTARRQDLWRFCYSPLSCEVYWDRGKRAPGRGAWLHPNWQCFEKAVHMRAFNRALRQTDAIVKDSQVAELKMVLLGSTSENGWQAESCEVKPEKKEVG